jgi:hypothetical protein
MDDDDDDEYRALGGMIHKGNRSTPRKILSTTNPT